VGKVIKIYFDLSEEDMDEKKNQWLTKKFHTIKRNAQKYDSNDIQKLTLIHQRDKNDKETNYVNNKK